MIEMYVLKQLAVFAEEETLSKAAKRLSVSQPALSRSMQCMETALGSLLFDRMKNRIVLNETGNLAADYARRITELEADMERSLLLFDRNTRTVTVSSIAPGPLMRYLSAASELFDDYTASTEMKDESVLVSGLEQGIYRLIILSLPLDAPSLFSKAIGFENLHISVPPSHPKCEQESVTFREMDGETFLMYSHVASGTPSSGKRCRPPASSCRTSMAISGRWSAPPPSRPSPRGCPMRRLRISAKTASTSHSPIWRHASIILPSADGKTLASFHRCLTSLTGWNPSSTAPPPEEISTF